MCERFVNPQLLKQLAVYKIKELLILHGADVNHINGYGYYNSSIWLAKIANAYEAGKVLIKHGVKFDIFDEIDNCYVTPDGTEHYENLDFLFEMRSKSKSGCFILQYGKLNLVVNVAGAVALLILCFLQS